MLKLRRKEINKSTFKLEQLEDETIDVISHFVLRLAYCRTEDLRRWFLTHETELLKFRLSCASTDTIKRAIREYMPDVNIVEKQEREAIRSKVVAASGIKADAGKIYKVPFIQALQLVNHRNVYIHRGQAYIPESNLITLVVTKFRSSLSRQLALLSAVPITPALERTQGFLQNVSSCQTVKDDYDKADAVDSLTANTVPSHLKNMPLCMAQLQLALQHEKHLKHWGRRQYGLFLKSAGLSLEDALQYFERMFTTKGFNKAYAYNVRHMYGKEGKRFNYQGMPCATIHNSNAPNANEHHGCPYKHHSVHQVTNLLGKLGISGKQTAPIIAQMQSHNPNLACLEHFKVAHPLKPGIRQVDMDNVGNHPNAWFKSSVDYHKANSSSSATTTASPADKKSSSTVITPHKRDVEMAH